MKYKWAIHVFGMPDHVSTGLDMLDNIGGGFIATVHNSYMMTQLTEENTLEPWLRLNIKTVFPGIEDGRHIFFS